MKDGTDPHCFDLITACGDYGFKFRVEVPERVFKDMDLEGMSDGVLSGPVASLAIVMMAVEDPSLRIKIRTVEVYAPPQYGGYIGPKRVFEKPKWFPQMEPSE